jgi:hypothetical protein
MENLNEKERNALRIALEVQIDILNDTLFEMFPYRIEEIRELALKSDEEIAAALKEMHNKANENFDLLESMQRLYNQLS